MATAELRNAVIKHVWSEPRFVAWVEWHSEHPSLARQMADQLGRGAMEQFAAGNGWPDPDAEVAFIEYDEPDWDWWEPTSEWRRKDAWRRACPR